VNRQFCRHSEELFLFHSADLVAFMLTNGFTQPSAPRIGRAPPPVRPLGKIAGLPDRPTNRAFIVT
jgi:hypothetical protein